MLYCSTQLHSTLFPGDGPHKPLAFDQILVHLFLLFLFNFINKILFKPTLFLSKYMLT